MGGRLSFRTGVATHVGKVRSLNEDGWLARPEIGLWVVADGMGGHGGGDVASSAIVAALREIPPPRAAAELLKDFEARMASVNHDLRNVAVATSRAVVGATLAAVLIYNSHFACVWCGDSRVYRLRSGALQQISRDHSEVQDLIDRGVIDKSEAKTWPRRNVVTRALGAADLAELEIVDGPILPGDRFLICSDGLTGHIEDGEIAASLGADDPQKVCDELVALTLERGANDNVTLVVVYCEDVQRTVRLEGPFSRDAAGPGEPAG